jgi:hypothetical protein
MIGILFCVLVGLWVLGLLKGNEIACNLFGSWGNWFIVVYLILSGLLLDLILYLTY